MRRTTHRRSFRAVVAALLASAAITTLVLAGTTAQAATPADCTRAQQAVRQIDPRLARTDPQEYARRVREAAVNAARVCAEAYAPPPTRPTTATPRPTTTTPRPTTTTPRPTTTTPRPTTTTPRPTAPNGPRQSGRAYANSEVGSPYNPNQLVNEGSVGGFTFICKGKVDRSSLRLHDPSGIVTAGPTFRTFGAGNELEGASYDWVAPDPTDDNQSGPRYELWVDGTCNGEFYSTARPYQPRPEPTNPGGGGGGSGGL